MPDICPVSDSTPPALGIVVCERRDDPPFAESSFIRMLVLAGNRAGLQVFAFAPWTWSPDDGCVDAWCPEGSAGMWTRVRRPMPRLLFDRSWPADDTERSRCRAALRGIAAHVRLQYLNSALPHKGHVYTALAADHRLAALLPATAAYTGEASLEAWLDDHGGAAFLKPARGSQGKRVAAYRREPDGTITLRGRLSDNQPFSIHVGDAKQAAYKLHRWIGGRSYLMQPLLDLRGPSEEPCDIRALVQKNGRGRWTLTGMAARYGRPGTVTANLHGGGRTKPAAEQLEPLFGRLRTQLLLEELREACRDTVKRLEQCFGRFAELGLDFGIDRSGRVWFLEANSKPGRSAMACLGESAEHAAVARPIAYARSILLRPHGRVTHEFDYL